MVDIQSAAAEIRRGKKKERRRRTNHSMKIYMVSLLHRATINKCLVHMKLGIQCQAVSLNIHVRDSQEQHGVLTPGSTDQQTIVNYQGKQSYQWCTVTIH